MYFDLWCEVFLLYPFLYVIYYCSKFQLFKICQLVYSPLFFLNSVTFYVKKWNYRITVIFLFLLAVNQLNSIISNFYYYFQDGRPTRYYNHRYYKPYNIYDYNRRTWQDHRHHIFRRKAIWRQERHT